MITTLLVCALSVKPETKIDRLTQKITMLHIKRGNQRMKIGKYADAAEDFLAALAETPNEPIALQKLDEIDTILNNSKETKYASTETQTGEPTKKTERKEEQKDRWGFRSSKKEEGHRAGHRSAGEEDRSQSIKGSFYEKCDRIKKLADEWNVNEDDSLGDIIAAKVVKKLAQHCPSDDKKESPKPHRFGWF